MLLLLEGFQLEGKSSLLIVSKYKNGFFSYVSCVLGCPYEGHVSPEAVAKVTNDSISQAII